MAGAVSVIDVEYFLASGRPVLAGASFRLGDGTKTALIGANGVGKSTVLRLLAGELEPDGGTVVRSGRVALMPQFIGEPGRADTVMDVLLATAPAAVRSAAAALGEADSAMQRDPTETTQMRFAQAVSDYADAGGYDMEVEWDKACTAVLGQSLEQARGRPSHQLSGGEQKRLSLELLLRGRDDVLLLDEPDNYLDVQGKRWLEASLRSTNKTVLLVTHDREVLSAVAERIVTLESGLAWTHGGGYGNYVEARESRHARMAELRRRWDEEHAHLRDLVNTLRQQARISDDMASRYRAARTRLEKFEEAGPPQTPPQVRAIRMRLVGGRSGVRVLTFSRLELAGLTRPFDLEVYYGDRVAVLGGNGTGKSHLLRLIAQLDDNLVTSGGGLGDRVAHSGECRLGASVRAGHFSQVADHPEWRGRSITEVLQREFRLDRGQAIGALRRYGLDREETHVFAQLSGGQKARFQVLVLELSGANLLLLDEPTDNLDIPSAEALEGALDDFDGTVLAVTHDRWFARTFNRFVVFEESGDVVHSLTPRWDGGDRRPQGVQTDR